jgi:hypothetical protein
MAGDRSRPAPPTASKSSCSSPPPAPTPRHAPPGRLPEAARPMTKRTHRHTKSAKLIDSTASRGWPTKPTLATTSTRSSPAEASAVAPGSLCTVKGRVRPSRPRAQRTPRTPDRRRGRPRLRDNPCSAPTAPRSELTPTPQRRLGVCRDRPPGRRYGPFCAGTVDRSISRPSPEIRGTMTEEELVAERPGSARAFQGGRLEPVSSRTPTSRSRFATADRPGRVRESHPGAVRAANGTPAGRRSHPRLRAPPHALP